MKRDGTPETWLEAWVLESGLGRMAFHTCQPEEFTRNQVEALNNSRFDVVNNPQSHSVLSWVRKETQPHRLAGAEPRTQPEDAGE
jgi:hypothetical protein